MTSVSSIPSGYGLAGMLRQAVGTTNGAIAGTTTNATLSGVASLLQGTSGASTGIFGALSGTATNNTVNIFSALGATGTMQSVLKERQAANPINPHLGNNLNITV